MENAYQFSGLTDKLKEQGVEVAEEAAKVIIKSVFAWLDESAELSATKYDDILRPFYPKIEEYVLALAEKINKAD